MGIVALGPEWRDHDIALLLLFHVCVDQPEFCQHVQQRRMARGTDAADLQIGPAGQIDQPIAITLGEIGDA